MAVQPHLISPSVGNYRIGRGFCKTQFDDEVAVFDNGNCPAFKFKANPTIKKHYSSRLGTQKQDFSAISRLEATLDATFDEMTPRNLRMALLSDISESPSTSDIVMEILSHPQLRGSFQFIDTSGTGTNLLVPTGNSMPQMNFFFPLVQFSPTSDLELIAGDNGDWSKMDIHADVLFDDVSQTFGTMRAYDFT